MPVFADFILSLLYNLLQFVYLRWIETFNEITTQYWDSPSPRALGACPSNPQNVKDHRQDGQGQDPVTAEYRQPPFPVWPADGELPLGPSVVAIRKKKESREEIEYYVLNLQGKTPFLGDCQLCNECRDPARCADCYWAKGPNPRGVDGPIGACP